MPTFEDIRKDKPGLEDDYKSWLKERQKNVKNDKEKMEKPDWHEFRQYEQSRGETDIPSSEPSDLLGVHVNLVSGLVGNLTENVEKGIGSIGGIAGTATRSDKDN